MADVEAEGAGPLEAAHSGKSELAGIKAGQSRPAAKPTVQIPLDHSRKVQLDLQVLVRNICSDFQQRTRFSHPGDAGKLTHIITSYPHFDLVTTFIE